MTDDDTPIRRRTRKPARNWTPYIVIGGLAVACVAAFVTYAASKYYANAEGRRIKAASTWWTDKATPAKIQTMIDDVRQNSPVVVYFTSDADFTRFEGDTEDGLLNRLAEDVSGVRRWNGVRTDFDDIIYFRNKHPERFSRPRILDEGRPRGLRMIRTFVSGRQPSTTDLTEQLIEVLTRPAVGGSVR